MSISTKRSESYFIPLKNVKQQISTQLNAQNPYIASLIRQFSLGIRKGEIEYILKHDYDCYERLIQLNTHITETDRRKFEGVGTFDLFCQFLKISDYTAIYFSDMASQKPFPAFIRNLFYYSEFFASKDQEQKIEDRPIQYDLMGVTVITYETAVKCYIEEATYRKQELDRIRNSNFSNTASYMGNKKKIAGFIIEAIFPHISQGEIFVDLMCGSGAMSQAFAQLGQTIASDAQEFCQLLAKIQGRGFTKERAERILKQIDANYKKHFLSLSEMIREPLEQENKLYQENWTNRDMVLTMYTKFVSEFELYSSTEPVSSALVDLIEVRRADNQKYPYCLFTLYFSNIYFGLLQCVQLDSLRYAVEQLTGEEKQWALGALIATTYQVSSGHAGHFAQPKKITKKNVLEVLSLRRKSAYHEFSKRFLCLTQESENCPHEIETIPGPWQNALQLIERHIGNPVIVYLDAPYKRDEYSRYYHVLETMTKYDYPCSEGKGRTRSKKSGERVSTEFFTKTIKKVEEVFVEIITNVLAHNMVCVWSYSDNGVASIVDVVDAVKEEHPCGVHLYGTQSKHHSQRSAGHSLPVMEYCIIFTP